MALSTWLFAALYFPALQLLPLALWHSRPRSETILQRMAATSVAAAALGWVPTARRLAARAASAGQVGPLGDDHGIVFWCPLRLLCVVPCPAY